MTRSATQLDMAMQGKAFAVWALGRGFERARPREAAQLWAVAGAKLRQDPWLACAAGDLDAVRPLLAQPGGVNQAGGPFYAPPLVMASHSALLRHPDHEAGIRAVVEALLAAGADVNGSYVDGEFPDSPLSALYGASGRVGDVEITRRLLAAGANPNDGESLYHSCEPASNETMRLLLEAGADPRSPNVLHHQLDFDDSEGLQMLLAAGADPNARLMPHHGPPALMWALLRGRDRAHFSALLDAGANPEGLDLAWQAARRGRVDLESMFPLAGLSEYQRAVVDVLHGRSNVAPPDLQMSESHLLPEAAGNGHFELVRRMVEAGWPVDVKGAEWGSTALNQAIFHGRADMVEYLLAHGADWRVMHGYGDNAVGTLSFASRNDTVPGGDYARCAELLIAAGMPTTFEKEYTFSDEVTMMLESHRG
jgi:ankyrin repeat protein